VLDHRKAACAWAPRAARWRPVKTRVGIFPAFRRSAPPPAWRAVRGRSAIRRRLHSRQSAPWDRGKGQGASGGRGGALAGAEFGGPISRKYFRALSQEGGLTGPAILSGPGRLYGTKGALAGGGWAGNALFARFDGEWRAAAPGFCPQFNPGRGSWHHRRGSVADMISNFGQKRAATWATLSLLGREGRV